MPARPDITESEWMGYGMNRPILYVDACVRKDSRTRKLAEKLLAKLGGDYEEVRLEALAFPVCDGKFLAKRDRLAAAGDWQDPMFDLARQFTEAETIVIAAPYWDLSFPAMLKQYLEKISERLAFKKWFFGHYHNNRQLLGNFVMLYEQIIQVH